MAVRVDVDSSTMVAWRGFEHRLAAELVELPIGYALELALPIGRSGPRRSSCASSRGPRPS